MYSLTKSELGRLREGVRAALALPFIDDIEDFIWEGVFAYSKNIPLQDTVSSIRSKRLFDIVDQSNNIGWSAKALQWNFNLPTEFELVVQRADIFKKAESLGFRKLNKDSSPPTLGKALLKHWNTKILEDAAAQSVSDRRICILLKSRDRTEYAYLEEPLKVYSNEELDWKWTDSTKTGLQGITKNGFTAFRWYPNQKQLFERFSITEKAPVFSIEPERLPLDTAIKMIIERLKSQ